MTVPPQSPMGPPWLAPPAIVLGYLFIMEHQGGQRPNRSAGTTWFDFFANALTSFSGRRSPADEPELFEAAMLMSVEFTRTPVGVQFHPRLLDWPQFFEVLVGHVRARNPLIDLVMRQPGVS
ncbi:MAG: hypothetical protein HYX51_02615 [Chloroflexi bacterium]|nr:hypothetical protein [Chloroflexota bacterium]